MVKIKLALDSLSYPDLAAKLDLIATGLTGNAAVPAPDPAPTELADAAKAITRQITALFDAQKKVSTESATLAATAEAGRELLRKSARDVEDVTAGDEAKILSTNHEVQAEYAPIGELPAPEGVQATIGDGDGELDVQCDAVRGAQLYEWSAQEVGGEAWVVRETDRKSRVTLSGLTSGRRYRVRVRAKGAAGWSPYSAETGQKTAP